MKVSPTSQNENSPKAQEPEGITSSWLGTTGLLL